MIRHSDPKLFTKWAHDDSQGYTQNNRGKILKVETDGETESKGDHTQPNAGHEMLVGKWEAC